MKRMIIAGGSGYLGRALARDWAATGYEVVLLSRGARRAAAPGERISVEHWDGVSLGEWKASLEGANLVVNLAGERVAGPSPRYRWTARRKALLEDSRRLAGEALVAALGTLREPPPLFVQASGIDYYSTGSLAMTETSPPGASYLAQLVSRVWEPSTAAVEALGIRRLVLRLGPILGPASPVLGPLLLQHRLFAGGSLGGGHQALPWISLADVLGAIRFLADRDELSGVFNLVAPGLSDNRELSRRLAALLGRPSWLPLPGFLLRLVFGEMAQTLLEGVRAKPARLLEAGYDFVHPDLDSALRAALP